MTKPFTLAVDVGGSHITVALVADEGVLAQRAFEVSSGHGLRGYLPEIENAAKEVFTEIPHAADQCNGIGMAVPMLVDTRSARVLSSLSGKFADAVEIDFREWAQSQLGLPLRLEVDAHAGCLGEWVYGAGKGCDDLVYVTLGTGYGTSVILRGKPLRGRTSQAGILGGHLSVNAGGNPCVCPSRGCIEAETGTWALNGIARKHDLYQGSRLARHDSIDYRILLDEADQGDALAKIMLERSLSFWGVSLVNLTHAYNPEKIIMGGAVLKAANRIIPFMSNYVRKHVWTASDYPEVAKAHHCETAALLGGRALFTNSIEYL